MKIEYQDWPSLSNNQPLYVYRCNVEHSTFPEKAVLGAVHEVTVVAHPSHKYNQAFRRKQDGTFFKKETCRWGNRFFTTQQEADQDRLEQADKLRKRLQLKIEECQNVIKNL